MEPIPLPANWCGIDAVSLRDGRHLLTYNHVPTSLGSKGGRGFLNAAISKDGKDWSAALALDRGYYSRGDSGAPLGQKSYPGVIQSRNGLVHIVYTFGRRTIGHIVVNPYKLTDANTVPMPDGKWPGSIPE